MRFSDLYALISQVNGRGSGTRLAIAGHGVTLSLHCLARGEFYVEGCKLKLPAECKPCAVGGCQSTALFKKEKKK